LEFIPQSGVSDWNARPATSAVNRVDLLTVVLHELGHVLGHEHADEGVMAETLPVGVRRVWDDYDLLFDRDTNFDSFNSGPTADRLTPEAIDAAFALNRSPANG
jgi:hypothetical protein